MDEVDKIILFSLKQLGCDFPNEITSVAEFKAEYLVEGTARCLSGDHWIYLLALRYQRICRKSLDFAKS